MSFVFSGNCRPGCARDRFHDGNCSDVRDPTEADLLRAEVERLRTALQEIADMYPDGPCACGLARAALEKPE